MWEVFVWGAALMSVIALYKYVSDEFEKGENLYRVWHEPNRKKLTLWDRIRLLFKDN